MKEKLIHLSTELFMRYGLKSVSMDDISREAGISKKTLYENIENKKQLISESLYAFIQDDQRKIDNIIEVKEYDALQQMIEIFKLAIKVLSSIQPTVIYDLQKYYKQTWKMVEEVHMKYMESTISNNLLKGMEEGIYRKNIDEKVISRLFIQKMIAVTKNKEMLSSEKPLPHVFFQNLLYHLHGIIDKSQFERLEDLTVKFKIN